MERIKNAAIKEWNKKACFVLNLFLFWPSASKQKKKFQRCCSHWLIKQIGEKTRLLSLGFLYHRRSILKKYRLPWVTWTSMTQFIWYNNRCALITKYSLGFNPKIN